MTIDIVIPAHNEEQYLGETVSALLSLSHISNIIVVDDGSTDNTADIAVHSGAKLVKLSRNQGKSAALMAGVHESKCEFILMLDADLKNSSMEAQKLIDAFPAGEDACVVAKFPVIPGRGGGIGLAVRLARAGTQRFGGWQMAAPLSGQRLLRRDTLEKILPLPYGFGLETSMNIRLAKMGVRLVEVDTLMDHRVTQNDIAGWLHRAKQLIHLLMAIVRECVR